MPLSQIFYTNHAVKQIEKLIQLGIPKIPVPVKLKDEEGINVYGYSKNNVGASRVVIDSFVSSFKLALVPTHLVGIKSYRAIPFSIEDHGGIPFSTNLFCLNAKQMSYLLYTNARKCFFNRYNIGYWFWETSEFPYERWKCVFNCLHEIWTSSSFTQASLKKVSPVEVVTIPPAITNLIHVAKQDSLNYSPIPKSSFAFLFIFDFFSYFERKNPLAVISAFKQAFGKSKDHFLLIQCKNAEKDPRNFKLLMQSANQNNIRVQNTLLSHAETLDLIQTCSCYVSLHRAEGFGLTIAEAMLFEKPVIITAYSGNMDFTTSENSYLVKYDLTKIKESVGPYEKGTVWAEPDVHHAAELMRRVYENPGEARQKAIAGAQTIKTLYNTERIGTMIKNRLGVIKSKFE